VRVVVSVTVVVLYKVRSNVVIYRGGSYRRWTYEVAGVTVTRMKLEQSDSRAETSGTFPGRVPVTALAQLSALQSLRAKTLEKAPSARPKARMQYRSFIFMIL
jgi:hypothetical protein